MDYLRNCTLRVHQDSVVEQYRRAAVDTTIQCSASEMTYIVSSGALNSTHSLTHHSVLRYDNAGP